MLSSKYRLAQSRLVLHGVVVVRADSRIVDPLVAGVRIVAVTRETLLAPSMSAPSTLTERMMSLDAATHLPNAILAKAVRAAVALSLETGMQFLKFPMFELEWRLSEIFEGRDGVGNWVKRQKMLRPVSPHLVDQPKMGFGVPHRFVASAAATRVG